MKSGIRSYLIIERFSHKYWPSCFYDCTNLQSVILSDRLTRIMVFFVPNLRVD
jgi:hypothetical protein